MYTLRMDGQISKNIQDGSKCNVVAGVHVGKAGRITDIKISKTGCVTISVVQANGERFKTLAKNVVVV